VSCEVGFCDSGPNMKEKCFSQVSDASYIVAASECVINVHKFFLVKLIICKGEIIITM